MATRLTVGLLAIALLGGVAIAALMSGPGPRATSDVWVAGNGDCRGLNGTAPCVTSINAGVSAVDASGTVHVLGDTDTGNGTFRGTFFENVQVTKALTLRGEDQITVNGEESNVPVILVQRFLSQVIVLRLTLQAPDHNGVVGVFIEDGGTAITLTTLLIRDVEDGVVVNADSSLVTIGTDCVIVNNSGTGIIVDRSHDITIIGNTIVGNRLLGLDVRASQDLTVRDNTIQDNGAAPIPIVGPPGPSPKPLQSGGGARFLQTDPTAVEDNIIQGNIGFGVEIGGQSSGMSLRGNQIAGNTGDGIALQEGSFDLMIGDTIMNNGGSGISLSNVSNVRIQGSTISGNGFWGIDGQGSQDVSVQDCMIESNGPAPVPVVAGTRSSGPSPIPLQSGGGARFLQTDPSEIRGCSFSGNGGPAIELDTTVDFTVADNMLMGDDTGGDYLMVLNGMNTMIQDNTFMNEGSMLVGTGTAILGSQETTINGNSYANLDTGILVDGGCHTRIGANSFENVTNTLVLKNPCDVQLGGATLRFTPRTLNLNSQGRYVTLRFEVTGLDTSQFNLASVSFVINGVTLAPPAGSPSEVSVHNDTIRAMVKLDRAEAIAAVGVAGSFTVTAMGELAPGVFWSASDTVDAILP